MSRKLKFLLGVCGVGAAALAQTNADPEIKEVIITVDPGSSQYHLLNQMTKVYNTHEVANELKENVEGVLEVKALDKLGMVTVRGDARAIDEALSMMPNVVEVEDNSVMRVFAFTTPAANGAQNGSIYSNMGMTAAPTNLASACGSTTCASSDVVVAVLDTGINSAHTYFTGRTASGGKNLVGSTNSSNTEDGHGHGSHVSSLIEATRETLSSLSTSNASAVTALGKIKILPIKVMADNGTGTISDVIEGINYAVSSGAKVINMSIGTDCFSSSLFSAVNSAYSNNIFISVAAGNDGINLNTNPIFPAALNVPGMLTVAPMGNYASNSVSVSSFSNYGTNTVDVFANGQSGTSKIYGAGKTTSDATAYLEGTSMAAPFVAGLGAAIRALNSGLTAKAVREIIADTSKIGNSRTYVTEGVIDAQSALIATITNSATYSSMTNTAASGNQYRSNSAPSCSSTSSGGSSSGSAASGDSSGGGGCLAVKPLNPNDPTNGPMGGNGILLVSMTYFITQALRRMKKANPFRRSI